MKGHDRQRIRVGLDGHTTVSCECRQVWDLGRADPFTTGVAVAARHATHPNVGDPTVPLRDSTEVPPDAIERGPLMAAWLRENPLPTPPRGSSTPTPMGAHGPAERSQEQATDGKMRRVRTTARPHDRRKA